jgi:glycine oxidase
MVFISYGKGILCTIIAEFAVAFNSTHCMASVDYIIVGQGLAGSALAIQLIKHKKRIVVIDDASQNSSSRIAAGMFNPITGKKMTKTWLADTLFPYLHQYYREVEQETGQRFFYPMPLYRPFISIEEQNEWMARSADSAYQNYIENIYVQSFFNEVHDDLGGIVLKHCGFLSTTTYIQAVRTLIEQKAVFIASVFDESALIIHNEYVQYQGFEAEKVIFCQGAQSLTNRWFGKVPIRPLKGETLTIKSSWKKHVILNRGVYIVPGNGDECWRIGATYNANDTSTSVTENGRIELEEKLKGLVKFPYEVLGHDWGVRPTTHDKKPILGEHRDFKSLAIFNGLGTKGVSLAPYFSEVFVSWLQNLRPIDKDVNVNRFKLLY